MKPNIAMALSARSSASPQTRRSSLFQYPPTCQAAPSLGCSRQFGDRSLGWSLRLISHSRNAIASQPYVLFAAPGCLSFMKSPPPADRLAQDRNRIALGTVRVVGVACIQSVRTPTLYRSKATPLAVSAMQASSVSLTARDYGCSGRDSRRRPRRERIACPYGFRNANRRSTGNRFPVPLSAKASRRWNPNRCTRTTESSCL